MARRFRPSARCATRWRKDGREGNSRGVGLRIVAYETQEDAPLLLVDRERVMH
jgi:hypothetical protein